MSQPNPLPLNIAYQRWIACMVRVLEIVVPERHRGQANAGFHQNLECHVGESAGHTPEVPARSVQHDSQIDITVRPEVPPRAGSIKPHLIDRTTSGCCAICATVMAFWVFGGCSGS
jgi:hypothetical protein